VQVDYARFHQTVPVSEGVVSRDSAKRQHATSINDDDDDDEDDDTSTTTDDHDRRDERECTTCTEKNTAFSAADKRPQR